MKKILLLILIFSSIFLSGCVFDSTEKICTALKYEMDENSTIYYEGGFCVYIRNNGTKTSRVRCQIGLEYTDIILKYNQINLTNFPKECRIY